MNNSLFIGIDGGGTGCSVTCISSAGIHYPTEHYGPLNYQVLKKDGFIASLLSVIKRYLKNHIVPLNILKGITVASAGISGEREMQAIKQAWIRSGFAAPLFPVTDIAAAFTAFFYDGEGLLLNGGTGSFAFARTRSGLTVRSGGWGYVVGDGGSGYAIGRDALEAAFRTYDRLAESKFILEMVTNHFHAREPAELLSKIYGEGALSARVAALAPGVIELAEKGNTAAKEITARAVSSLQELIRSVEKKLPTEEIPGRIGLTGSLFTKNEYFLKKFLAIIPKSYTIEKQKIAAEAAAALIGMAETGFPVAPELFHSLEQHFTGREAGI